MMLASFNNRFNLRLRKRSWRPSLFSLAMISSTTFIQIITISTNILVIVAQEESVETLSESGSESEGCDIPPFSTEGIYSASDQAFFKNVVYECKPPPDDTWCSNMGYEPGVGIYWENSWNVVVEELTEGQPCFEDMSVPEGHEANNFFCGRAWGDADKDCDAAQPCPTGQDSECEFPGQSCFGGTACDLSKGHGKYYELLGFTYEDGRNNLFCECINEYLICVDMC